MQLMFICFGVNKSLRQYFKLYQAISQRQEEKEIWNVREKYPNHPAPHLLHAQRALALSKLVGGT